VKRADLLKYCLGKPGATRAEPWEGDVVAKVAGKIFAFVGDGRSVGLKCGPTRDDADELIARFPEDVAPLAYIGRFGWNRVQVGGEVADDELLELIDTSYDAIVSKLPKSKRP
jgi:predicted DNA-binding protein (MmcQ/YjbR family)